MTAPLSHRDLERRDIALLTHVLSHATPSPRHPSTSAAASSTASLIRHLPPHLKSAVPSLSPGCRHHRRLEMAPLDSLVRAFRHEVTVSIATIWEPLQRAQALDSDQASLLGAARGVSDLPPDGCPACWLQYVGANTTASVAVGALTVGRVSPGIYQKSKRLIWIEEMLRQTLPVGVAEAQIRRMWDAGIELRQVRKEALELERPYVAEYVRRARGMDMDGSATWVPEPAADALRMDDASIDMNTLFDVPADETAEAERDVGGRVVSGDAKSRPPQPPDPADSLHSPRGTETPDFGLGKQQQQQARMASSIYSQDDVQDLSSGPTSFAGSPSWWNSPGRNSEASSTGTQIIDLYRDTADFPEGTAFDARSSTTDSRVRSSGSWRGRDRVGSGRGGRSSLSHRGAEDRGAPGTRGWERADGLGIMFDDGRD